MEATKLTDGSDLLTILMDEVAYLLDNPLSQVSAPVGDFYAVSLIDGAPHEWLDSWSEKITKAVDEFRPVSTVRSNELVEFQVEEIIVLQPSFRFDALDFYLASEGLVRHPSLGAGFSPSQSLPAVLPVGGRIVLLDGTHRFLAAVTAGCSTFWAVPAS